MLFFTGKEITEEHNTSLCSYGVTIQYSMAQYRGSTVYYSTVLSTVQYSNSNEKYNGVHYITVQCSTVQFDITQ